MENRKLKKITIADDEPYLRQVSEIVDIEKDKNLHDDIAVLDAFCKENDVMAMAAIQLGIPKRLVYLKNTNLELINKQNSNTDLTEEEQNYNEARVLINPVIIKREGLTEYWEACASCLDNCGKVLRPYKIEVEYYDIDGEKHTDIFEGFESTVLSHEMDHLDGILHIDIALEVLYIPKDERKKLRQKEEYKVHTKTGDYNTLKNETTKIKVKTKNN